MPISSCNIVDFLDFVDFVDKPASFVVDDAEATVVVDDVEFSFPTSSDSASAIMLPPFDEPFGELESCGGAAITLAPFVEPFGEFETCGAGGLLVLAFPSRVEAVVGWGFIDSVDSVEQVLLTADGWLPR